MAKKINYTLILTAIFLFHAVINYQVLERSRVARIYDEVGRLRSSLGLYKLMFLTPEMPIDRKIDKALLLGHGQGHPRFFELVGAFSWKALNLLRINEIEKLILITNSLFVLVLLISVYGIGSVLYNNKAGLLSAFMISMFPLVFGHSRLLMIDLPLMSMTALSLFLLLKTDGFQSTFFSILTGVAFGLSQLTKEGYIIFILPVLVYYSFKSYRSSPPKGTIINFIIFILIFLGFSAPVYFRPANQHVFKYYLAVARMIRHCPDPLFYVKNFVSISGPLILFMSLPPLLSHLVSLKGKDKFLFLWFFIPLIIFSISSNKTPRFILPALSALPLIIAGEVFTGGLFRRVKTGYIFILLFLSLFQFALYNYGFWGREHQNDRLGFGLLCVQQESHLPVSSAIIDMLKKETPGLTAQSKEVIFIFEDPQIYYPVAVYSLMSAPHFNVSCALITDEVRVIRLRETDWDKKISNAGYIVDRTGPAFVEDYRKDIAERIRGSFNKYVALFTLVLEIKAADGSSVRLYKNISLNVPSD